LGSDSIWCEGVGVGVGARGGSTWPGGDYLRGALGWEKWANLSTTNKARSHKHTQAQATQPLHRGPPSPIPTAFQHPPQVTSGMTMTTTATTRIASTEERPPPAVSVLFECGEAAATTATVVTASGTLPQATVPGGCAGAGSSFIGGGGLVTAVGRECEYMHFRKTSK